MMKRKRKMATHYFSKHLLRLRRRVYSEWRRITKDLKYGRRYLCIVVSNVYKSRLSENLNKWRQVVLEIKTLELKQRAFERAQSRRRLLSAFDGMKENVVKTSKHRGIFKLLLRNIAKALLEAFWQWKLSTIRQNHRLRQSVKMEGKRKNRYKSKSFDVWKAMRVHGRQRNSSLDIAFEIGMKGVNKTHFFRWLKETRHMRVMAHVDEKNFFMLEKCFFQWRVFLRKIYASSKVRSPSERSERAVRTPCIAPRFCSRFDVT